MFIVVVGGVFALLRCNNAYIGSFRGKIVIIQQGINVLVGTSFLYLLEEGERVFHVQWGFGVLILYVQRERHSVSTS